MPNLGHLGDLYQAHTAVARHRQALVVAESGNFHASLLAGLQHRGALGHADLGSVHNQLHEVVGWRRRRRRRCVRCAGRGSRLHPGCAREVVSQKTQ